MEWVALWKWVFLFIGHIRGLRWLLQACKCLERWNAYRPFKGTCFGDPQSELSWKSVLKTIVINTNIYFLVKHYVFINCLYSEEFSGNISWNTGNISILSIYFLILKVTLSLKIFYHSVWKQSRVLDIPILTRKLQKKSSIASGISDTDLSEVRTDCKAWN